MLTPQADDIFREGPPPVEPRAGDEAQVGKPDGTFHASGTDSDVLARLSTASTSLFLEAHVDPGEGRAPLPRRGPNHKQSMNDGRQLSGTLNSSSSPEGSQRVFSVRMKVESNFRGNEGLRSITYFLIRTTTENSIPPPPGIEALAQPPKTVPPHLRSLYSGLGLVQWNAGKEVMVQRRYSEACALRELLTYQFPHLLIPPLRVKGIGENWDSYLNKEDVSNELSIKLQFFLQQLMGIPALVFMSDAVQAFATDPRDTFETVTLPRIQEKIKAYHRANKVVIDFSGQQKEFSSTATNAIVNVSTKTIKSVVNFFTGYKGNGGNEEVTAVHSSPPFSSADPRGTPAALPGNTAAGVLATGGMNAGGVGNGTRGLDTTTGGMSRLGGYSRSAEVAADIDYWNNVSVTLTVTRKHLKDATVHFNQYLSQTNKAEAALQTAAEAAKGFSAELRSFGLFQSTPVPLPIASSSTIAPTASAMPSSASSADTSTTFALLPPLEEGFEALSCTISEMVEIKRNKRRQQFIDVCSRLRCETDYIKAILFRIDDILSLYAYVEKSNAYECMSPTWIDAMECAQEISKRFREDYENSYKPKYNFRMQSFKKKVFAAMHDGAEAFLKYREDSSMTAYTNRIPEVIVNAAREFSESPASHSEDCTPGLMEIVENA